MIDLITSYMTRRFKMNDNHTNDKKTIAQYKKWHQLKQKQQIIVSTLLRDSYIMFVLENKRKPSKALLYYSESIILLVSSLSFFLTLFTLSATFNIRALFLSQYKNLTFYSVRALSARLYLLIL